MRVLFRVDGDTATGLGHVTRCLNLARALDGEVLFASKGGSPGFHQVARHFECLPCEDNGGLRAVLRRFRPDVVVVDLLGNSDRYLSGIEVPTVSLFDSSAPSPVSRGIVINHNILQGPSHGPVFYLGPAYVIVSPAFRQERLFAQQCRSILVNSGGSDPYGLTLKVVAALSSLDDLLTVVVGAACPDYEELRRLERQRGFALYHDVANDEMAALIKESDIVVTAGGNTLYECAAAATPSIVVCHHHRHEEVAAAFAARGAAINLGVGQGLAGERVLGAVRLLMGDAGARRGLGQRAQSLVDGRGVERVATLVQGVAG